MDDAACAASLEKSALRPAGPGQVPAAWSALLDEASTPDLRVRTVASWWPSGVLTGYPMALPDLGGRLVDVRAVLDRRDRPRLAYLYRAEQGWIGALVGSPPAGPAATDSLVPEPWRSFFADVHESFGGVDDGFSLIRPDPGATLTAHLDHPLLTDQEDWTDPPLDDACEELPLPRPEDLVVVGSEVHGGWVLMLHPDLAPGKAYSWWDEMLLVDLADDAAQCISSRTSWDSEPYQGPPLPAKVARLLRYTVSPTAELLERIQALPEARRVEYRPPADGG